jgi:hypothetical protein
MSPKKRRKVQVTRRESRRPRGWTRWFREGLLEGDTQAGVRLSTTIWGAPAT